MSKLLQPDRTLPKVTICIEHMRMQCFSSIRYLNKGFSQSCAEKYHPRTCLGLEVWKWGQISTLDINLLLYSLSPCFISQINVSSMFQIHYDSARIERSRVPQLSGGRVRCGHPPEAVLAWRATFQGLAERLKLFPNDSSTFVFLGHLRLVLDSCNGTQPITKRLK